MSIILCEYADIFSSSEVDHNEYCVSPFEIKVNQVSVSTQPGPTDKTDTILDSFLAQPRSSLQLLAVELAGVSPQFYFVLFASHTQQNHENF